MRILSMCYLILQKLTGNRMLFNYYLEFLTSLWIKTRKSFDFIKIKNSSENKIDLFQSNRSSIDQPESKAKIQQRKKIKKN